MKERNEKKSIELVLVMKHTRAHNMNVERVAKKWRIYGTLIVNVDFFLSFCVLFLHSSARCAFSQHNAQTKNTKKATTTIQSLKL